MRSPAKIGSPSTTPADALTSLARKGRVASLSHVRSATAGTQAMLEIGFALALMKIVDAMAAGDSRATWTTLVPFVSVLAGLALLTGVNTWLSGRIIARGGGTLRMRMARHFSEIGYDAAGKVEAAGLQTQLTAGLKPVLDWVGRDRPLVFLHVTKFLLAAGLMWLMNGRLMLAAMVVFPLFVWMSGKTSAPLASVMEDWIGEQTRVNGLLAELQAGLPVVKAFRMTGYMAGRFSQALDAFYRTAARLELRKASLLFFEIFLNYAPFIGTFLLGGLYAVQGSLSPGGILAFLQLVGCLAEPAAMLPVLLSRRHLALGAATVLSDTTGESGSFPAADCHVQLQAKREPASCQEQRRTEREPAGLHLEALGFSRSGRNILTDIDLQIHPGEVVALVGVSGSGKTTLLHLLAGLLEPDTGTIRMPDRFDGNGHMPGPERMKFCALVSQQPVLYPWSLLENLRCVRPEASLDEIRDALRSVGAHWLVEETDNPSGGTLHLEGSAKQLSGGQAQRVTLARALLKGAPVLLLDEPTSALDVQAGSVVTRLVKSLRGRTTVILAAHQWDTIRCADRVVLLAEGRISAVGTHQGLLSIHPGYQRFFAEMHEMAGSLPLAADPAGGME